MVGAAIVARAASTARRAQTHRLAAVRAKEPMNWQLTANVRNCMRRDHLSCPGSPRLGYRLVVVLARDRDFGCVFEPAVRLVPLPLATTPVASFGRPARARSFCAISATSSGE